MILNGWKEIARHLGRGVRMVQRWEACFGMPVIRPAGRGRSAVCACSDDLDAWLRQPHRPEQLHERIRELKRENEALKRLLSRTERPEPLENIALKNIA